MPNCLRFAGSLSVVLLTATAPTSVSWGQSPEGDRAQRLVWMTEMAAEYEFHLASQSDERMTLRTVPVFRWTNPIRNSTDGAVFLWTAQGRPQVMVGIFTRGNRIYHHEFQSLALEGLVGRVEGQQVWNPPAPGVEFRPVPDSPKTAESAAVRLCQMKALSQQFSSFLNLRGKSSRKLRLLPRPIYRYGSEGSAPRDGTLFVFSTGTDPETMLLLQADSVGSRWEYALARMTWAPVEARYKERPVWEVDYWYRRLDPSRSYIVFKNKTPK